MPLLWSGPSESRRCTVEAWSITREQREDLYRIMLDAYGSRDALDRLLWLKLNRNLGSIAAEIENHDHTVFAVLKAAEQQGWLDGLVAAAVEERPEHRKLTSWADAHLPVTDGPPADPTIPVMVFDLGELHRIAGQAVGSIVDLVFESVEIYTDATVFSVGRQGGARHVLVRVQAQALSAEAEQERFAEEVQRARRAAAHPRVADLLLSGLTEAGHPYIVQRVDQGSVRRVRPLPVGRVVDIGAKLADALTVAHNRGATFGRIGPSHVLLAADGEPTLTFPQLPMFARPGTAPATPYEDVGSLCETLLSMLGNGRPGGRGPEAVTEDLVEAKLRQLFAAAAQGRLIAAALRDQLETLKRDSVPAPNGFRVLARVPGADTGRLGEGDVVLVQGDLFEEEADLVVGFSDTFDTATADSLVISSSSLQGQLIHRIYHGDVTALDADLDDALASVEVVAVETRDAKRHGKLRRYPVGTVAVLERDRRRIFAVAFSRMDNNLTAGSTTEFLRHSLSNLWQEIRRRGSGRAVAMPVVGSGLSRLDLSREALVRMILASYREHAQSQPICRELRVVVHPSDSAPFALLGME
ncbi:macro domain-containing protein [Streptomyces mirabilis]